MCHKDSGQTLVIVTIAIYFDFTMYSCPEKLIRFQSKRLRFVKFL